MHNRPQEDLRVQLPMLSGHDNCCSPNDMASVARTYFMPSNLAEAMIKLLEDTANDGLNLVKNILARGEHILGNMWISQLSQTAAEDLNALNTVLPGLVARFERQHQVRWHSSQDWLTPNSWKVPLSISLAR